MAVVPMVIQTEERQGARIPFSGNLSYRELDSVEQGHAEWQGMSLGGASIRLGRYLRPGRRVELNFQGSFFPARVVWSQADGPLGHFDAGLCFDGHTPEPMLLTLAALRRTQIGAEGLHIV